MEIAAELDISQATVSKDLKVLQKEWQEARINDIDERKRQELAKIDNLELEHWEGWRRSQQDAEVQTVKMLGKESPDKMEKTRRTEGQVGDPRFLTGIQWCINKRCELLGLDAPKRQDITSNDQTIKPVNIETIVVRIPEAAQEPDAIDEG